MDPEEGVTGKRSPQWAFMSRLKISKPGYGLYLDRLRIFATPYCGLYLHHIVRPDPDPDPHDHPWPFATLVLRGGYVEEFHPFPNVYPPGNGMHEIVRTNRWNRWSWHRMGRESAHRITHLIGDTWTLVFVGRRRGSWGFWRDGELVPWQEYTAA